VGIDSTFFLVIGQRVVISPRSIWCFFLLPTVDPMVNVSEQQRSAKVLFMIVRASFATGLRAVDAPHCGDLIMYVPII
jgi:hypothetical protein